MARNEETFSPNAEIGKDGGQVFSGRNGLRPMGWQTGKPGAVQKNRGPGDALECVQRLQAQCNVSCSAVVLHPSAANAVDHPQCVGMLA
jgi:hypothetical protein